MFPRYIFLRCDICKPGNVRSIIRPCTFSFRNIHMQTSSYKIFCFRRRYQWIQCIQYLPSTTSFVKTKLLIFWPFSKMQNILFRCTIQSSTLFQYSLYTLWKAKSIFSFRTFLSATRGHKTLLRKIIPLIAWFQFYSLSLLQIRYSRRVWNTSLHVLAGTTSSMFFLFLVLPHFLMNEITQCWNTKFRYDSYSYKFHGNPLVIY